MNRKSLLSPGLYRICAAWPDHVLELAGQYLSKWHTSWILAGLHPQGVRRRTLTSFRLLALWAVLAQLFSLPALADVADTLLNIKPGVVGVGTFKPIGSPRANLEGTGFAVLDGRYVVSCAHIFSKPLDSEKNEAYAVFLGHDRRMAVRIAQLIATDKEHDLALLKIDGTPIPPLKLGNSSQAREGVQLYFTGYPIGSVLGLNPSTHRAGLAAIIPVFTPVQRASQLDARTLKQAKDDYDVYELDAVAYPGNSGSPVWNPETGDVLGVVNSVYVKGSKEAALTAPSGISYAIPVKYVNRMLEKYVDRLLVRTQP
jgi:serine protease Do